MTSPVGNAWKVTACGVYGAPEGRHGSLHAIKRFTLMKGAVTGWRLTCCPGWTARRFTCGVKAISRTKRRVIRDGFAGC
jgi:hypothetical protein